MAIGPAKKSAVPSGPSNSTSHSLLPPNGRVPRGGGRAAPEPPSRAEIRRMAESLGRLADEGRLRILFLLEEASRNVAALGEALGQERHSLSHHLRILRVSGLIQATRNGRRVDYSLTERGRLGVRAARSLND